MMFVTIVFPSLYYKSLELVACLIAIWCSF